MYASASTTGNGALSCWRKYPITGSGNRGCASLIPGPCRRSDTTSVRCARTDPAISAVASRTVAPSAAGAAAFTRALRPRSAGQADTATPATVSAAIANVSGSPSGTYAWYPSEAAATASATGTAILPPATAATSTTTMAAVSAHGSPLRGNRLAWPYPSSAVSSAGTQGKEQSTSAAPMIAAGTAWRRRNSSIRGTTDSTPTAASGRPSSIHPARAMTGFPCTARYTVSSTGGRASLVPPRSATAQITP